MQDILKQLGIEPTNSGVSTGNKWIKSSGKTISSFSPVDGKKIADVTIADDAAYEQVMKSASDAFLEWRMWPSP
ncbi:MAG TPA: aldehyde dehydrogenase family protein, partial [Flavisolibacter sp.]